MKTSTLMLGMAVLIGATVGAGIWVANTLPSPEQREKPEANYQQAVYSALHFKPAIESADDAQCLACHKEILNDKPRVSSPAGARAENAKAWYQQLTTYSGEQDSFHRRHLSTPFAKQVMNLKCNFCHQGHDPRDEAPGTSATAPKQTDTAFTLRKQVNPETTCLKCHGQMPWQNMALPGPWMESKEAFQNNCLLCHATVRTVRHQVNYLHANVIEEAGKTSGDACYGCHGGRAWYRIAYPYPRHAWPDMPEETPDWAKERAMESEARFAILPTGKK